MASHRVRTREGPILVLDPIARHTVAAVRGLGMAGWDVVVAGFDRPSDAIASRSRYARRPYERLPDPHGPAAPFGAALAEVVRRRGCQAVVAVSDSTIAQLRGLSPDLAAVPRLDASLDRIIDKVDLASSCATAGVAYPTTWLADDRAPASAPWPRIVKPRRTAMVRSRGVVGRTGAFVVENAVQEAAAIAALRAEDLEPMVQVRVDRTRAVSVAIVRHRRQTTVRLAYRVLLEYPPRGGQAAAIVAIDPHEGIGARAIAAAERVCDAAGFEGLANAQLYVQPDGSPCLIEINPRVYGSMWFPERLGLRVMDRAVLAALGEAPSPAIEYRPGRRFHRPVLEAQWLLAPGADRGPAGALPAIVRPWDVFDLVSVRDPLPLAAGLRHLLRRAGSEMVRRRTA